MMAGGSGMAAGGSGMTAGGAGMAVNMIARPKQRKETRPAVRFGAEGAGGRGGASDCRRRIVAPAAVGSGAVGH